jgi:two-component system chemotaxis response regulator CheY
MIAASSERLRARFLRLSDIHAKKPKTAKALPGFVLLDWNMPVMNGLEFLQALRKLPGGDAPHVVFCTTENDLSHIQEALGAGANEYIMKPFDADIIRGKLEQLGLI